MRNAVWILVMLPCETDSLGRLSIAIIRRVKLVALSGARTRTPRAKIIRQGVLTGRDYNIACAGASSANGKMMAWGAGRELVVVQLKLSVMRAVVHHREHRGGIEGYTQSPVPPLLFSPVSAVVN